VRITTSSPLGAIYPSLVWATSQYGLAWHDGRDGGTEVYFVRLSGTGTELGAETRISDLSVQSRAPELAWSGSEFGVTWEDMRDGNEEVYFSRVSELGVEVGTDVLVSETPGISAEPTIAWTGSDYVTSWSDHRHGSFTVYLALVSPSGVKTGTDVRVIVQEGIASLWPALAWSGSDMGLAYRDTRGGTADIYLTRIGFCY
jgi:hypothetical protein